MVLMQFSSHFQDYFPFQIYKELLYSVIHFNCINTATYITGFKLHCFFHWVNNRVLLNIRLRSARANELEDRQTYRHYAKLQFF